MLHMPWSIFFIRAVPEEILLIFANYVIVGKKIDQKRMIVSGIILAISSFVIRSLPIHFGVHTVLMLMVYIFVTVKINKIDMIKTIPACIIATILFCICDWLMVFAYTNIFHIPFENTLKGTLKSTLYTIPSLILIFLTIMMIDYFKKRRNEKIDV